MDVLNRVYLTCWLLGSAMLCTACNEISKPLSADASPTVASPTASQPGVANPATQKCLQDGYTSEAILSAEGVPVGHVCVNQKASKKCEEWAYLRGECRLEEDGVSPSTPSSSPKKK